MASVNYAGAGNQDVLLDHSGQVFGLARFDPAKIVRADGRNDHNHQGFIHGGTNVIREIPQDKLREK